MAGPASPFYYLLDDEDNLDFKSYEERIADLENEPAYKRRNVTLDDVSHSSESSVSHFSINEEVDENGERKI